MRTFHTGGVATGLADRERHQGDQRRHRQHRDINAVEVKDAEGAKRSSPSSATARSSSSTPRAASSRSTRCPTARPSGLRRREGQAAPAARRLGPAHHAHPGGEGRHVRYEDIEEGETARLEEERKGGQAGEAKLVVIEHKGERHPRITIEGSDGKILDFHYLPAKARIEVADGQKITAGQMLAASRARAPARWTSPAACRG
jgi:DNA-directed RNA polymerase subunit beta'